MTFQSKTQTLPKPASGYGYKYTPLDVVIDATRDGLAECGLAFVQFPGTPPVEYYPAVSLTTRLMHISGEWLEDTVMMPIPQVGKANETQNYGAALTYARRYALTSILGLAADEDVDANPDHSNKAGKTAKPVVQASKEVAPPMPTAPMKKKFHAIGTKKYGDEWDDKRPELVKAVAKKRDGSPVITSSNELYRAEMQYLIDGMSA